MRPARRTIGARLRTGRGIPLRAVAPNAVTALALCFGITGIRFAISASGGTSEDWEKAVGCILVAAVLDGLDGRVARLLKGESRFGAELDSLSDVIAFGVSPAIILYLWTLQYLPKFGWTFALAHAVCCALRLARFNAQIDADEKPQKAAGFLTGVPAPAGAIVAMLPLYLWLWLGLDVFRTPVLAAIWIGVVAVLMISSLPTFGTTLVRLRRDVRLWVLALVAIFVGTLISAPWPTLSVATVAYVAAVPFSIAAYARFRRQRAAT